MEIVVKPKQWGSSLGIILPKEIVLAKGIVPNKEITITISNSKPLAGVLFGKFPRKSNKTAQQIKDEMREGWESDSDRERAKRWK